MEKDKIALMSDDFETGRLNFSSIGGIQKSDCTEYEFKQLYQDNPIYTRNDLMVFKSEQDDIIQKGMVELDDPEYDFRNLKRVVVKLEKGGYSEVFIKTDVDLSKAKDRSHLVKKTITDERGHSRTVWVKSGGKLTKKSEDNDIEKALLDYDTKVKVTKTGKDIKEKLNTLKPNIETIISDYESQAQALSTEIGKSPTREVDSWEYGGSNMKSKIGKKFYYKYPMTSYNDEAKSYGISSANTVSIDGAESKEQAEKCREYNSIVSRCISHKKDLIEMQLYINTLNDTEKYELSPKELLNLGF